MDHGLPSIRFDTMVSKAEDELESSDTVLRAGDEVLDGAVTLGDRPSQDLADSVSSFCGGDFLPLPEDVASGCNCMRSGVVF